MAPADGSTPRDVTTLVATARFGDIWAPAGRPLSWSPDSQQVAYHEAPAIATDFVPAQINVINMDGRGKRALTSRGSNFAPVWTPDGRRLAFTTAPTPNSDSQIQIINADGGGSRALTTGLHPVWSPDGKRLAFLCGSDWSGSAALAICVMNADGSGREVVFRPYYFQNQAASFLYLFWPALAWSPDSRRLAFHAVNEAEAQIHEMNADGTGRTVLTTQGYNWAPVWAPNGQQIAFNGMHQQADRGASTEVFVMNTDGSGLKRLTGP